MKINHFKIENFRNIRFAECHNLPGFVVICGGNGCGKSALLQALMTAKEHAAPSGGFNADPRSVSANADKARIHIRIRFSDIERQWYETQYGGECPELDDIIIEIAKGGRANAVKRSNYTKRLLSSFSRDYLESPGFFDYIDAHRLPKKKDLSTWNASALNDSHIKQSFGAAGDQKFAFTKEYLASLVFGDLQQIQSNRREGSTTGPEPDSLAPIREFFDDFFAPMKFVDVLINRSPFQFIIRTPRGDIDIDDMSAGEKEVLNTFIRFHQLQPRDAVILFDEADAHLHPDLERRYLEVLRTIGQGNQIVLTTHSPEMMIEAGSDALFTVLKAPPGDGDNQFVQVTSNEELHGSLSELMGSRGLVSFNQRIVFIEGTEASADRLVYERLYPPGVHNVSFVPVGNSGAVRTIAERVNDLLTSGVGFQHYYSIVDGDLDRVVDKPEGGRLFKLPVYHVENLLLDEEVLFGVTSELLGAECPYSTANALADDLKQLLFHDTHLNGFTKALLDAQLAKVAKAAYDAVYNRSANGSPGVPPEFASVKKEAEGLLKQSVEAGTWRDRCKGRDLLRAFCGKHRVKYNQFRNLLVARFTSPPAGLDAIMQRILDDEPRCTATVHDDARSVDTEVP